MKIIIQGKPLSGSKVCTAEVESTLADKIYKDFFESMGVIRTAKALVVDTIYWQNVWYTVYSYSRYQGILDTANRQSYFTLSIVVPRNYLYLTSGVYHLLEKVYKEKIEGVYISPKGKYLVSDFADSNAYNDVEKAIEKEYVNSNLEDPINGEFKKTRAANIPIYNLYDCDSIAFLQDLKENGRVVVGEGPDFPKKCAANVVQSKEQQLEALNVQLSKLKSDLAKARQELAESAQNSSEKVKDLQNRINQLKEDYTDIKERLKTKQQEYDELIEKIQAVLPNSSKKQPEYPLEKEDEPSLWDKCMRFLPMVNCILIIICLYMVRPNPTPSSFSGGEPTEKRPTDLKAGPKKEEPKGAGKKSIGGDVIDPEPEVQALVQITLDGKVLKNGGQQSDGQRGKTLKVSWAPQQDFIWVAKNYPAGLLTQLNNKNNYGTDRVSVDISLESSPPTESYIILNYRHKEDNSNSPTFNEFRYIINIKD